MKPKKPTLEDQLAFISAQHEVYPTELFQALIQAKEQGKSACGDLTVEYRGSVNNEAIFLITKNSKVIAQFRVPQETLLQKDVSFDNWMDTSRVRKEIAKQNPAPTHMKIENLTCRHEKGQCNCQSFGNFRAIQGSHSISETTRLFLTHG